jgi:spore coat protein CotF
MARPKKTTAKKTTTRGTKTRTPKAKALDKTQLATSLKAQTAQIMYSKRDWANIIKEIPFDKIM